MTSGMLGKDAEVIIFSDVEGEKVRRCDAPLAAYENSAFFMGVVNHNQRTFLLWRIWGHF